MIDEIAVLWFIVIKSTGIRCGAEEADTPVLEFSMGFQVRNGAPNVAGITETMAVKSQGGLEWSWVLEARNVVVSGADKSSIWSV